MSHPCLKLFLLLLLCASTLIPPCCATGHGHRSSASRSDPAMKHPPMVKRAQRAMIKKHLSELAATHGHKVFYTSAGPPCAYIKATKWSTNTCSGSQTSIIIIPGECITQFSSGGIATDIIYTPAAGGQQMIRFVYSGTKGVCGSPDRYDYQDVITPGQCLEGWTYTWDLSLPKCWIKWQEFDQSSSCETTKLATTTYMEPNRCFYDQKFGLTWGLACNSSKTTSATTTLYQQQPGNCTGTPYATYPNAACMNAFASGIQFKATYTCP